jgi:hypothetical protein
MDWSTLDERAPAVEAQDNNNNKKKDRALTCNDCNRRFCLDYDLPKCKGAKEDDVIATCFRTFVLSTIHMLGSFSFFLKKKGNHWRLIL